MFKVGEKVVYPAHGVGVIQSIQTKVVSGTEKTFYMLRILDSDMTIMIPTENVATVGLRRVIGKEMVTKVYKILRESAETSARRFKFDPVVARVAGAEDFAPAIKELIARKADALLPPISSLFIGNSDRIAQLALKARLPLFSTHHQMTAGGGLLSYGTQLEENYRRAAALVDKILRGAKPGDLAVELPERFQLIVNLKTARAINVTLSPTTMLRADRVIE